MSSTIKKPVEKLIRKKSKLQPSKKLEALRLRKMAKPKADELEMPEGSGALVFYSKQNGKLITVAVVALKTVSAKSGLNPLLTTVENICLPLQLSFASGKDGPVWKDLLKFKAYRNRKS